MLFSNNSLFQRLNIIVTARDLWWRNQIRIEATFGLWLACPWTKRNVLSMIHSFHASTHLTAYWIEYSYCQEEQSGGRRCLKPLLYPLRSLSHVDMYVDNTPNWDWNKRQFNKKLPNHLSVQFCCWWFDGFIDLFDWHWRASCWIHAFTGSFLGKFLIILFPSCWPLPQNFFLTLTLAPVLGPSFQPLLFIFFTIQMKQMASSFLYRSASNFFSHDHSALCRPSWQAEVHIHSPTTSIQLPKFCSYAFNLVSFQMSCWFFVL